MKNVEKIGVNQLESFIATDEFLDPKFPKDDKNISWDGEILVFDKNTRTKEDVRGKIPVQIKCENAIPFSDGTTKHNFKTADLRNYQKTGGIILFLVQINDKNEVRFFYKDLLPSDLKSILKNVNKKKNHSIIFKQLETKTTSQIQNICRNFLLHQHNQYSTSEYSLSIKDCLEIYIPFVTDGSTHEDYALSHELLAYGKKYHDSVPVFLDKIIISNISKTYEKGVFIGGKKYYEKYIQIIKKNEKIIKIGQNILVNSQTSAISYKLEGSIEDQLIDCGFLLDFINAGSFSIGESSDQICRISNFDGIVGFKEKILTIEKLLRETLMLLTIFKIEPAKLDIYSESLSQLDLESKKNLDLLIRLFVRKENVVFTSESQGIQLLKISNLIIGVIVYKKNADSFFKIINLFDDSSDIQFSASSPDENHVPISPIVILTQDSLVKLSNIDFDFIVKDIKKFSISETYLNIITLFGLELIKSFDVTNNHKFVECATEIFDWTSQLESLIDISRINILQIVMRQRLLDEKEIKELADMKINNFDNDKILFGINVLLENKYEARTNFSNLPKTIQEEYINFPIYSLAKKLGIM